MSARPDRPKNYDPLFEQKAQHGCQLCGWSLPDMLYKGLERCHIIELRAGGTEAPHNLLALCPSCHKAFDMMIKPAIWKALYPDGAVPRTWAEPDRKRYYRPPHAQEVG